MNILVVDDEYFIVKNIVMNLDWESLGINEVFSAYSARQAREVYKNHQVDILLADVDMPQETGLQLVSWIRQNDYQTVVLLFTGHQKFAYAVEAVNLHVFKYVLKTAGLQELSEEIKNAVYEANKQDQLMKTRSFSDDMNFGDTSDQIFRIKTYIRDNISSPALNRTQIADYMHMSPDYLSHYFTEKTGYQLNNYIRDKRIKKAQLLLADSSLSIQQISDMTGFSSVSYFHTAFKNVCGVTPQQYRQSASKSSS